MNLYQTFNPMRLIAKFKVLALATSALYFTFKNVLFILVALDQWLLNNC